MIVNGKKITLKKVNLIEKLSEETPCFTADLYQDGVLLAHVSNRGQGSCNDIHPAKGFKYNDIQHLTSLDADCDIMGLAEEASFIKKSQAKAFVVKKDGKLYTLKLNNSFAVYKKAKSYDTWLSRELSKIVKFGYEVLNTNL